MQDTGPRGPDLGTTGLTDNNCARSSIQTLACKGQAFYEAISFTLNKRELFE